MYDGLLLDHDGVLVTIDDGSALAEAATAAFRDVGVVDPAPDAVVSNNQARIVETVLDRYELSRHVDTVRARAPTPGSLDRKKPRPTFLADAMNDLALANPLYVGDSESDVEAGHRAGLDVAFIRRAHNGDRSLDHEPTYEVDGLDDVAGILNGREH